MNLIEFVINFPVFLFCYIALFLWHELMHAFEAFRQGCPLPKITPDFKGLTMYTTLGDCSVEINDDMFALSGGIYTSIVAFILTFFSSGFWQWTFLTLGWLQLLYGIFEYRYGGRLSSKLYKIGRYSIYIGVIIFCIIVF